MSGHFLNRGWSVPSRGPNASVVKENDLVIRRQAVRYRRVPSIHVAVEVSETKQRCGSWLAETAKRVTDPFAFNELCRNSLVGVAADSFHLSTPQTRFSTRLNVQCGGHR